MYDEPPKRKKGQRGRPRKYGRKYMPKRIAHLKRSMVTLPLYGKEQEVRYRSKVLMAHFLGGRLVRVVWCEFKSESGHWKKAHLLLSTDAKLTPEQIIEAYGERWSIESMFNQLKLSWCRVPCDYIPKRSYPLFRTRQILNDWLTQNLEEA
ncbi:transposase [Thiolapillus sp.]|uniref:transposase n=1 Tax=Thiolapillus sp. TaxID=2017437 RepID=UPI0034D7562D